MGRGSGASAVKLYYRIGEVAGIVGVEPHVLRYWESEFPSIRPQKSRSGQRVYSRRDVDKLLRVKELLYTHRFTIAGARQRLRDGGSDNSNPAATEAEAAPSEQESSVSAETESLRTSAQTLRSTLLAARNDICRLIESFQTESGAVVVGSDPAEAAPVAGEGGGRALVTSPASSVAAGLARREQDVLT